MSVQQFGLRFICDLCEATGEAPPPPPGWVDFRTAPRPDGWTALELITLRVVDLFGTPVTHLCPACSALSIGEFAGRLTAKMRKEP